MDSFRIVNSNKTGLHSNESYIVMRDETSFLRILGKEPKWEVITATASEDHGQVQVCKDQRRLMQSALRLCEELKTEPRVGRDRLNREYVSICVITREQEQSEETFDKENLMLFRRFFEIYDEHE
jgi:hypothetical protein